MGKLGDLKDDKYELVSIITVEKRNLTTTYLGLCSDYTRMLHDT